MGRPFLYICISDEKMKVYISSPLQNQELCAIITRPEWKQVKDLYKHVAVRCTF